MNIRTRLAALSGVFFIVSCGAEGDISEQLSAEQMLAEIEAAQTLDEETDAAGPSDGRGQCIDALAACFSSGEADCRSDFRACFAPKGGCGAAPPQGTLAPLPCAVTETTDAAAQEPVRTDEQIDGEDRLHPDRPRRHFRRAVRRCVHRLRTCVMDGAEVDFCSDAAKKCVRDAARERRARICDKASAHCAGGDAPVDMCIAIDEKCSAPSDEAPISTEPEAAETDEAAF